MKYVFILSSSMIQGCKRYYFSLAGRTLKAPGGHCFSLFMSVGSSLVATRPRLYDLRSSFFVWNRDGRPVFGFVFLFYRSTTHISNISPFKKIWFRSRFLCRKLRTKHAGRILRWMEEYVCGYRPVFDDTMRLKYFRVSPYVAGP